MPRPDTTSRRHGTDTGGDPAANSSDRFLRRTILKASAVAVGTLGTITPVSGSASDTDQDDEGAENNTQVDEPEGFSGEVLAQHARFRDDVSAAFTMTYAEGDMGTVEVDQDDFQNVVVAKLTWEPGGTTGWHTHNAPVIVNVESGELELTNELDCVERTYSKGEAFAAQGQGNIHRATNPSESERAVVHATYLGVPDGEPPTIWVEPPDC